jgi:hypothetical protein
MVENNFRKITEGCQNDFYTQRHRRSPTRPNQVVRDGMALLDISTRGKNQEIGSRLEVATGIALKRLGVKYTELTGKYQDGHVADYSTENALIECKNWIGGYEKRYRVTQRACDQIISRFEKAGNRQKICIITTGMTWDKSSIKSINEAGVILIEVPPLYDRDSVLFVATLLQILLASICRKTCISSENDWNGCHYWLRPLGNRQTASIILIAMSFGEVVKLERAYNELFGLQTSSQEVLK